MMFLHWPSFEITCLYLVLIAIVHQEVLCEFVPLPTPQIDGNYDGGINISPSRPCTGVSLSTKFTKIMWTISPCVSCASIEVKTDPANLVEFYNESEESWGFEYNKTVAFSDPRPSEAGIVISLPDNNKISSISIGGSNTVQVLEGTVTNSIKKFSVSGSSSLIAKLASTPEIIESSGSSKVIIDSTSAAEPKATKFKVSGSSRLDMKGPFNGEFNVHVSGSSNAILSNNMVVSNEVNGNVQVLGASSLSMTGPISSALTVSGASTAFVNVTKVSSLDVSGACTAFIKGTLKSGTISGSSTLIVDGTIEDVSMGVADAVKTNDANACENTVQCTGCSQYMKKNCKPYTTGEKAVETPKSIPDPSPLTSTEEVDLGPCLGWWSSSAQTLGSHDPFNVFFVFKAVTTVAGIVGAVIFI